MARNLFVFICLVPVLCTQIIVGEAAYRDFMSGEHAIANNNLHASGVPWNLGLPHHCTAISPVCECRVTTQCFVLQPLGKRAPFLRWHTPAVCRRCGLQLMGFHNSSKHEQILHNLAITGDEYLQNQCEDQT